MKQKSINCKEYSGLVGKLDKAAEIVYQIVGDVAFNQRARKRYPQRVG